MPNKPLIEARRLAKLCYVCGSSELVNNSSCGPCLDKAMHYQRVMRQKRKDRGLCWGCGKKAPLEGGTRCGSCRDYINNYTQKRTAIVQARNRALKLEVFEAYGGCRCVCCGEENPSFLNLDHIHNDGSAHRQHVRYSMYRWAKNNSYPPIFQILCFNCNIGRHFNGGICPHKEPHA